MRLILVHIMLRKMLYLIPVLLLVGTGCIIGNHGRNAQNTNVPAKPVQAEDQNTNSPANDGDTIAMQKSMDIAPLAVEANTELTLTDPSVENLPQPLVIDMKSGNFFFDPPLISAKPGQKVEVRISANQGLHTFVIDELAVKSQLADGTVISFTAPQKIGDYPYYCDIGSHRELGMEGVLRVEE